MIDGIINQLRIDHIDIDIHVVPEIWDWDVWGRYTRCERDTMGICEPVNGGFNIRVVDGHDRNVTIAHELYHVFQHVNGLELTESLAESFGQTYA